jgi:hypothetical protein
MQSKMSTSPVSLTEQEFKAAVEIVRALGDAIKELGSIPSGHLYMAVASKMSLQAYSAAIMILKKAGKVKEQGHLLTWVGV